ncbi:hypothetical protein [Paraflavitalea pollutisoli]|uniref:hypothetical protein n=1 Tax=Paraflavitalea pollutisoli TaxID=3034143 RepID=UPI0023EC17D2|nr:hypothetical protein [Paraflavitalea sp. H1-2-19X]
MTSFATVMPGRTGKILSYEQLALWTVFGMYLLLLGLAIVHHEPWGDEVHSWNIAKGSATYLDVIRNSRFEGHPPTWYTVMWLVSKCTHHFVYVQVVHGILAATSVWLILFYAPLPFWSRLLAPFGYFLLFEYATLTRNYAIGVLLACCICVVMHRPFKGQLLCYYALLLLLSNTHLLGLLLAGSIHVYYILDRYAKQPGAAKQAGSFLLGLLCLLPAGYFITPPTGSALDFDFWLKRMFSSAQSNFMITVQAPLRVLVPLPAWWQDHWWNTQFLLDWQGSYRWLKYGTPLLALFIAGAMIYVLRRHRPSLWLFLTNLSVTALLSMTIFPIGCARYGGYIFISWIVAWWLSCYHVAPLPRKQRMANGLLIMQALAALVAIGLDWNRPFSNFNRVGELAQKVPASRTLVCDYWGLNAVAAFMDQPMYCMDLQQETAYLLWNERMAELMRSPYRYSLGAQQLNKQGVAQFYMISSNPPPTIIRLDDRLEKLYAVTLVDKREGAVESGGNLYLYSIQPR